MSGATAVIKEEEMKEAPVAAVESGSLVSGDIRKSLNILEKGVNAKEARYIARVLRSLPTLRKRLSNEVLGDSIVDYFHNENDAKKKQQLLGFLKLDVNRTLGTSTESMDITSNNANTAAPAPKKLRNNFPEAEVYLHLLVTIYLVDHREYDLAAQSAAALVEKLESFANRSTMNPLSAKVYFYYARSWELAGKFDQIRVNLLNYYRTATLRHNDEGAATLLNSLLRNYLAYKLYEQADKLVSKVTFKEDTTSSNQYARYLYYLGKIKSVQLEYTEAYTCLLGAIRKAPQNSAKGFRIAVHKLLCIVELLMGEIPERSIFRQPGLKNALAPYYQLTHAVRIGDLNTFHSVIDTHSALFKHDDTYTLIQRLHHNVIKTGLRKINLAYTRISFNDICEKLHLGSVDDALFIVAKAIKDGVISATINYEGGYLQSKETTDVYSTREPLDAFHKRIKFCLKTHNDAVKAMRFPENSHKPVATVESVKERREREAELQKAMEDDDDDF